MLLRQAGLDFVIRPPHVDETPMPGLAPVMLAETLAVVKARAVSADADEVVLAADTVGELDGALLVKPVDAADARRMLRAMSGRTHAVHTGVAVRRGDSVRSNVETTHVAFRALAPEEIDAYVSTGEPLDKAGAYAIQGGAADFVARVDGPLDNVVGLPMGLVRALLDETP